MKQYTRYAVVLLLGITLLASCSRKKNSFPSRAFHSVTAEYNILYNGNVAFEQGRSSLAQSFQDNYWEILPVERIEVFEEITRPGASKTPEFEKAEEKAIKAIQRHSMKIDNEEYNPQMDEAFILLGKSRYFDQRFIPALEAFNYVLAFYPTSNNIAQAKIWKEKTNIRLDNNELAIDNLRKLFKVEKDLKDQDQADAYAMLAQAYVNLGHHDTALVYIKDASRLTRKNEEKGRYNFIKGQLYNKLAFKDSANMAFDEVIALNRRIPRKYWINAQLQKIKNFDYESGDQVAMLEFFQELEENRENREYLDRIYYTKAEFYMNTGVEDSAIAFYNRSLKAQSQDQYLVSRDYLALAEYNFNNAEYLIAGAYYDSTMGRMEDRTREFRRIKKKRENLTDVIKYETLSMRNDSIMRIAAMSEDEQRAFFENYIKEVKERAKKDSIRKAEIIRNNEFFKKDVKIAGGKDANGKGGRSAGRKVANQVGEFFFYNSTAVAYGKQDFEKRWGRRPLEDYWRLSNKQSLSLNGGVPNAVEETAAFDKDLSVDTFLATIPTEQKALDSLKRERDDAYYQLGLIYKEKFKEYPRSADKLETLLSYEPEERLVLPAKYYLYQVYMEMDASAKANAYKSDITSNYPESRYASILNNPEVALEADADSPESLYSKTFRKFENQNYAEALADTEVYIDRFYGDAYVPKFELLKATILGRYEGYDAYKKALEFVALTYPRSEEGKKAQALLQTSVPAMAFKDFNDESASQNWKLLYTFGAGEREQAQALSDRLETAFSLVGYTNYATSIDSYSKDKIFVVVHYLTSRQNAGGVAELLAVNKDLEEKDLQVTQPSTIISSENYKKVQIHKNLKAYEEQFVN